MGVDRSMADTFFRPGFTQGVWAAGQPVENLYYNVMIGNSLNTLQIGTGKIDTNMAYSGSVWWEPLGSYGPGEAYNDLEKHAEAGRPPGQQFHPLAGRTDLRTRAMRHRTTSRSTTPTASSSSRPARWRRV